MAENKNAQQVREITDKLEQGIKELFESERFKEYLRTMSKFYNYSFNNTLLIAMQKPEATYVAGYTSWQRNFDRQVMKGEKGIKILAPAPYKAQEEREKIDPVTQKPVIGADGMPSNQGSKSSEQGFFTMIAPVNRITPKARYLQLIRFIYKLSNAPRAAKFSCLILLS